MLCEVVSRLTTHGNYIGLNLFSQLFTLQSYLFLIFPSSHFQSSLSHPSSILILLVLLFWPVYTLTIYLFLLCLLLLLLLLFSFSSSSSYFYCTVILTLQHLSSSHNDFIFSFWLPTLFLLLILLYFIIHFSFFPLLFLSSTSVVLHILSLNQIF